VAHRDCSDPVNMGLLMLPLMILYLLSVLFAAFARREKVDEQEKPAPARKGQGKKKPVPPA
jgi:Sec-independent protein secretion pathway component TatC